MSNPFDFANFAEEITLADIRNEMTESTLDEIVHRGSVLATDPAKGTVTVALDGSQECGACPAARLCLNGERRRDTLEIQTDGRNSLKTGDRVEVSTTEVLHRKAIMLATVLPCVALVAVMVAVFVATGNQGLAAICGLASMILFFVALYAMRGKIAHELQFKVRKSE